MPYANLRNGLICKAMNFLRQCTLVVVFIFVGSTDAFAQGPSPSYFHDLGSQIPWAECAAYQPGGSSQRIPFIPAIVTAPVRAPAGTQGYSRDVLFDSHLVFVGEGLAETASDPDSVPDVDGSVALMTFQSTSSATATAPLRASVITRSSNVAEEVG